MIRFGWINSILGGCLASLCCPCCFLPLFLNLFGIGCAGLNTVLAPYRPVFISLTAVSLTYSYVRYRPSKSQFVAMLLVTLCLTFSPEILRFCRSSSMADAPVDMDHVIAHWQITGMHCESCRSAAERALVKIDGVLSANVDLDSGQADLISRFAIEDDMVTQAVQSAGFQAYKII